MIRLFSILQHCLRTACTNITPNKVKILISFHLEILGEFEKSLLKRKKEHLNDLEEIYNTRIFKYSFKQHNIGNLTIEVDLKTTQLILTKTKKYEKSFEVIKTCFFFNGLMIY